MTLDPKKLEAATRRYVNVTDLLDDQAQHIVTELLEAYGVPELEARAAQFEQMTASVQQTNSAMSKRLLQQAEEIVTLKAEPATLKG